MKEADVAKSIVVKSNNRDRVGLTSTELSHLHQQLAGITTTCTLIIGFAMASVKVLAATHGPFLRCASLNPPAFAQPRRYFCRWGPSYAGSVGSVPSRANAA